jgi:DNA (cytosine-5)-methyltransferase 1
MEKEKQVQTDVVTDKTLRIHQATELGYVEVEPGSIFDGSYPNSKTRRGRVQEGGKVSPTLMASGEAPCLFEGVSVHPNSHALEFKGEKSIKTDVSPALRATDYKAPHCVWENSANYRIRKLTPKECFRLMGVSDADIEKIQNSGVSQSQQYKMAGNSIVVDVLEQIFRKMFVETGQESEQLYLF